MDLQTAPAVHPPLLDSVTEETLRRNVAKVLETLAENRYQDSPPAKLVAVTKTVTPRVINLLKPMEIWDIGENRAQVALPKLPEISPEFHLHWIGRLQTNKVKYIIDHVCLLHALDRMDLAQEIDRRAGNRWIPLDVARANTADGFPTAASAIWKWKPTNSSRPLMSSRSRRRRRPQPSSALRRRNSPCSRRLPLNR